MSGLLPGERGVLTAIIVGVCFEVSLLQDERGKGATPVRPALLGWRTDGLLHFLPSKLNEITLFGRFTKSAESEADVTIISVPILKPISNANI
jgi:hypothetical protein